MIHRNLSFELLESTTQTMGDYFISGQIGYVLTKFPQNTYLVLSNSS